jgi:hypothetical protein
LGQSILVQSFLLSGHLMKDLDCPALIPESWLALLVSVLPQLAALFA